VTGVPFLQRALAITVRSRHNNGMDSSSAISSAVAGVNAGSAIAVSVLSSAEKSQAQQIATLFSSIGLGRNFSASA